MDYVTGTYGNHIIEGTEENHKPVVSIPDDSVLFNPDHSWNREKIAELVKFLGTL